MPISAVDTENSESQMTTSIGIESSYVWTSACVTLANVTIALSLPFMPRNVSDQPLSTQNAFRVGRECGGLPREDGSAARLPRYSWRSPAVTVVSSQFSSGG